MILKSYLQNAFVFPHSGLLGPWANRLVSNQPILALRRAITAHLPFPILQSDIQDVIYLNWVLDVEQVAHYLPPGVQLWQRQGKTIFTVLTYRHRHFGPVFLGPLRQLCPSPLQSNWRLYLEPTVPEQRSVLFVKNSMNHVLYALGSRLFSDVLPSHLAESFTHQALPDGYETQIQSGIGSSPDLFCRVKTSQTKTLPGPFEVFWQSWPEAIRTLCLQDAALSYVADTGQLVQAGIDLPIDIFDVIPLQAVELKSQFDLLQLPACQPEFTLCFRVPKLCFRVLWEKPCLNESGR